MRKVFLLFLVLSFAVSITGLFAQDSTLFFSEYIEGDGGNNKALEIYNPTDQTIDLSDYLIMQNANGGPWNEYVDSLKGQLAPGEVYVIANAGSDEPILSVADTTGTGICFFNGDDARALVKVIAPGDTVIIDVIGTFPDDPGSGWDVAGVTNATANHTLVRKESITKGNSDWAASAGTNADDSEWIVYDANTFDYIGWHNKIGVTFQVDMSVQVLELNFDPAADVVRCVGSVSGWSFASSPPMTNADINVDSIYTITYHLDKNVTYYWKYAIGDDWGNNEDDPNREFTTAEEDTILPLVYFNDDSVVNIPADSVNVTFQVDMSVQVLESNFDPTTEVVRCVGSMTGWSFASSPPMTNVDINVDSIYTITYRIPGNDTYYYKYAIGDDWGNNEDDNREVNVGINDTTLAVVYFNNDSVVNVVSDGNITFNVDMSVMEEVGIFDGNADSVQILGDFNGWNDDDPSDSHLNQNFVTPEIWFLNVAFQQQPVGGTFYYKYFAVIKNASLGWTDGWERPCHTGGGNRAVIFKGTTIQETNEFFDGVMPEWVIEDGKDLQVTFSVNMSSVTSDFVPSVDTVYWICEQTSFVATQGWEDTNDMKVLPLTHNIGDTVFSGTFTVQDPAFNSFVYRYAYYDESAQEWIHEPEGYANFAYRTRYIGQDANRSFPVNPWIMPLDTWTEDEIKTDQETDPFTSYVGVDDEIMPVPTIYTLNQNYPNPFNPVTTITYTLAKSGKINLAVYNLLGQKVRTLVNSNATAGLHINKWNGLDDHGKKVASGIYFYKLEASNFTAVKKMIMLK